MDTGVRGDAPGPWVGWVSVMSDISGWPLVWWERCVGCPFPKLLPANNSGNIWESAIRRVPVTVFISGPVWWEF